jgi:hypothetical protein
MKRLMKWLGLAEARVPRGAVEALGEEEVRRVETLCRTSTETARCVAWLTGSVRDDALRAIADAKPGGEGYAYALAKLAGMVSACAAVEAMWDSVLDGTMAEALKTEREEREKGERSARRKGGAA